MPIVLTSCGVINEDFKERFFGLFGKPVEELRMLYITTAADGESGERFMLPALQVPVVDTTGAGDNLVAGFIDGLLRGLGFRECCEAGILAAAKSIQHLGATVSEL